MQSQDAMFVMNSINKLVPSFSALIAETCLSLLIKGPNVFIKDAKNLIQTTQIFVWNA